MVGYQPAIGELVGVFVGAGNLRNITDGSGSYVKERSNVLLMPWGSNYPASAPSVAGAARSLVPVGRK
jgi:hypothetical protein